MLKNIEVMAAIRSVHLLTICVVLGPVRRLVTFVLVIISVTNQEGCFNHLTSVVTNTTATEPYIIPDFAIKLKQLLY